MVSVLFTIFALQLVIHLINKVGASTINELLWLLYSKLPTKTAHAAQEQGRLKAEVVRLKKEMSAVSAQDDFARWAKIRRQHDKALAAYEKSGMSTPIFLAIRFLLTDFVAETDLRTFKASFDTGVSSVRWVSTTGLRLFLNFYYSKQPLFWIPEGWLPGYVEWILSFPRAPRGSISVQIWQLASGSVIGMAAEAINATYALATKQAVDQQKGSSEKPQPMRIGSGTPEVKKEL